MALLATFYKQRLTNELTYSESGVVDLNRRCVIGCKRIDVKDVLSVTAPGSCTLEVIESQVVVESVTSKGSELFYVILRPVRDTNDHGIFVVTRETGQHHSRSWIANGQLSLGRTDVLDRAFFGLSFAIEDAVLKHCVQSITELSKHRSSAIEVIDH